MSDETNTIHRKHVSLLRENFSFKVQSNIVSYVLFSKLKWRTVQKLEKLANKFVFSLS
jgi:hypothetical protein